MAEQIEEIKQVIKLHPYGKKGITQSQMLGVIIGKLNEVIELVNELSGAGTPGEGGVSTFLYNPTTESLDPVGAEIKEV